MHFQLLLTFAASAMAANIVKQHVVFSSPGVADVVGNGFGCANIGPELVCIKHVFTDGFTVGTTEHGGTKAKTLCSIKGTEGACGPNGLTAKIDLTGGTGNVPPPSGPQGTTTLTPAELVNLPIGKRAVDWEA